MGLIYANIKVTNYDDILMATKNLIKPEEIRSMQIKVLVDTGASMLVINEHIKNQLGLKKFDEREVEFADGRTQLLEIVGPLVISFENRTVRQDAFVLTEGEPLLGAIAMEEMDVMIHPLSEKLIVNPDNPFTPKLKLK